MSEQTELRALADEMAHRDQIGVFEMTIHESTIDLLRRAADRLDQLTQLLDHVLEHGDAL